MNIQPIEYKYKELQRVLRLRFSVIHGETHNPYMFLDLCTVVGLAGQQQVDPNTVRYYYVSKNYDGVDPVYRVAENELFPSVKAVYQYLKDIHVTEMKNQLLWEYNYIKGVKPKDIVVYPSSTGWCVGVLLQEVLKQNINLITTKEFGKKGKLTIKRYYNVAVVNGNDVFGGTLCEKDGVYLDIDVFIKAYKKKIQGKYVSWKNEFSGWVDHDDKYIPMDKELNVEVDIRRVK